jgi:hypothetical protein
VVFAAEPRSVNGTAPARARKARRESEDDMAGSYHNGSAGRYIAPRRGTSGDRCRVDQLISNRGRCADLSNSRPVLRLPGRCAGADRQAEATLPVDYHDETVTLGTGRG